MNKKIKFISILFLIVFSCFVVKAEEYLPNEARESLTAFINNMNTGNPEVFNYIDTNNTELYGNVQKYLNGSYLIYEVNNIDKLREDEYTVKGRISASGAGWNVTGFQVDFKLKKIDDKFIITDTTLFNVIGTENVLKFSLKIFAILGAVFAGFVIIVVVIVLIVLKKQKAKKVIETNAINIPNEVNIVKNTNEENISSQQ